MRREVTKHHQAYIVYPLIEASESLDLGAAVAMARHLQQDIFPEFRVGLLHGRLPGDEKDAIMQAFVQGELDILVSTTVIEVGVDICGADALGRAARTGGDWVNGLLCVGSVMGVLG